MGEKTYLLGTDAVWGYLKENPSLFYFTNAEKKGQLYGHYFGKYCCLHYWIPHILGKVTGKQSRIKYGRVL